MKVITPLLCAVALSLAACSTERVNIGAAETYEGYYDGHYGTISDGYWGPDGYFYFSLGEGQPFQRDTDGHIRRSAAPGYSHFHGSHVVEY